MKLDLQAPVSTLFNATLNTSSNNVGFVSTNNSPLNAGTSNLTAGLTQTSGYLGYYWNWWEPYNSYYHSCYHAPTSPDKFETAFKLSRKLMDKKLVKPQKTVEDFFKLMDAIVEVL